MVDKITTGDEVSSTLLLGATRLVNLLKPSYGPLGAHIILSKTGMETLVLNSGNGIIEELGNDYVGSALIKDAIVKMTNTVGDGTTTTALILEHLLIESFRFIASGGNPIKLRKNLELLSLEAQNYIIKKSKPIEEKLPFFHFIAGGDCELALLIQQALETVNDDGIVMVRDSKKADSYVEVIEEVEIDQGYLSDTMITDIENAEAVLDYPYILLTDIPIVSSEQLVPLLNAVKQKGKTLFIMAPDITGEALATLNLNNKKKNLHTLAVRATAFGQRRKDILEDLAIITGATVISQDLDARLENCQITQLGSAKQVRATQNHTYIIGGNGDSNLRQKREDHLHQQINTAIYEVDRVNLENRLARLSGHVATIYIGACTAAEMRAKRQATKSSVAHARSAIRSGVVPGGGVTLFHAGEALRNQQRDDQSIEYAARQILASSLQQPFKQLLINSRQIPVQEAFHKLRNSSTNYGYDLAKGCFGEMASLGIVDSAEVLCKAIMTATSIVGVAICTDCIVTTS